MSDGPADDDGGVLGVWQHSAGRVVEAEVGGAVDDDALHGHSEASVESSESVRFEGLRETIAEAAEFALAGAFADVGGETGTREVERVHEAERRGSGGTSGGQVTGEVAPELRVLVDSAQEHLLVLVLEGEVERLGREVPDDVGEVAAPEGHETLLLGDTHEGVDDALVALVHGDLLRHVLHLEEQLDALDGRHHRLRDGGGDAARQEVFGECHGVGETGWHLDTRRRSGAGGNATVPR